MAKRKRTTVATPSAEKVETKSTTEKKAVEVKQEKAVAPAKYNGGVIIDGKFYRMGEAKSRQMVKEGKATLA